MRKKNWEKVLSSSYVSIKNKTYRYINSVLARTAHFIVHIEKSQFGKVVLGHQMLFSNIKN